MVNPADPVSLNNMNGSQGEAYLAPKEIFSDENENKNDSNNIDPNLPSSFTYSTDNSDSMQNILVAEAGEPFQDERSSTPPMPSLIPSQDLPSFPTDCSPKVSSADVQSCSDVDGFHGSDTGILASSQEQLDVLNQPSNVSTPESYQAGLSCSSQDENEEQIDVTGLPLSKGKVDVENITLCELRVTRLEGHADVVFSVAADEDFVLTSRYIFNSCYLFLEDQFCWALNLLLVLSL